MKGRESSEMGMERGCHWRGEEEEEEKERERWVLGLEMEVGFGVCFRGGVKGGGVEVGGSLVSRA